MEEFSDVECSDEESAEKRGAYEPPADVIVQLYGLLDQGIMPELKWQSPGYRSPSPKSLPSTPVQEEFTRAEEKSDFDFMDEMSAPQLPVRREGESSLKGSAKKKTTSLDGVLSNMRRHRRLEQQMLDGQPSLTSSSS